MEIEAMISAIYHMQVFQTAVMICAAIVVAIWSFIRF